MNNLLLVLPLVMLGICAGSVVGIILAEVFIQIAMRVFLWCVERD